MNFYSNYWFEQVHIMVIISIFCCKLAYVNSPYDYKKDLKQVASNASHQASTRVLFGKNWYGNNAKQSTEKS